MLEEGKYDIGWVETVMIRRERDKGLCKVLWLEATPAVAPGDNYTSDLLRVKMRVVLGSGRIENKSIIIKTLPKNKTQLEYVLEAQVFSVETKLYTQILPKMEELILDHGDNSDNLWCNIIYIKPQKEIVMEDLKMLGFGNADRREGLDLEHVLLVIRGLARLHAMSYVLLKKDQLDSKSLLVYSMSRGTELISLFMQTFLSSLVKVIKDKWDKKWSETAEKLEKFTETVSDTMQTLWEEKTNEIIVLNHGDCWTNNFMFKYNVGTTTPSSFRFVDFQESHFNTSGWDLTFLFYTSLSPSLREEKTDLILEEYLKVLRGTLDFYGEQSDEAPTLDGLKNELNRLLPFALMVSGCILPILTAEKEDVMDLEKLLDPKCEEGNKARIKMLSSKRYTQLVQRNIQYCLDRGKL